MTLTRAFRVASTEVTQAQFKQLMGYNPAFHQACGAACPVEWVHWHEAAAYCNALSALRGAPRCYSCSGAGDKVRCEPAGADPYACAGFRLPDLSSGTLAPDETQVHAEGPPFRAFSNDARRALGAAAHAAVRIERDAVAPAPGLLC